MNLGAMQLIFDLLDVKALLDLYHWQGITHAYDLRR
jgi:hypothetical protein